MNYRSVVVLGTATAVTGPDEKIAALEAFTEKLLPGRWAEARTPSRRSSRRPRSCACRSTRPRPRSGTGGPDDGDTPDAELDVWAGHLPLVVTALDPVPDPALRPGIPVPPDARSGTGLGEGRSPTLRDGGVRHRRDEVRRLVGRRPGEDPPRRAPLRRGATPRALNVVGTVSAMGKTTDSLIALASEVSPSPEPPRARHAPLDGRADRLRARRDGDPRPRRGRRLLHGLAGRASSRTHAHTRAKIREIRGDRIRQPLAEGKIVLVAGFQGFSRDTMEITTLGRGAGDLTAVALAATLGAACEIHSDVAGVFTADPRIVPAARKIAGRLVRRDARDGRRRARRCSPCGRSSWPVTTACASTRARRSPTRREPGCRTYREWSNRSSRPSPTRRRTSSSR